MSDPSSAGAASGSGGGASAPASAASPAVSSSSPAVGAGAPSSSPASSSPSVSAGTGSSSPSSIPGSSAPAGAVPTAGGSNSALDAAAAAAGAPPNATVQEKAAFVAKAKQFGFNYESEEQVLSDMVALRHDLPRLQRAEQQLQQIQPHLPEFQTWLQQKHSNVPAASQQAPEDPAAKFRAPKWNQEDQQEYERYVEQDANGNSVLNPMIPADLRDRARAFANWRKQAEEQQRDPFGHAKAMGFIHKDEMETFVAAQVNQMMQQLQQKEQATQMVQGLERHLSSMKDIRNPDGSPTQLGTLFAQRVNELESIGGMQPQHVIAIAERLARADVALQQTQLQSAQEQSRVSAGLPAVAAMPSSQGATQVNPNETQPLSKILDTQFKGAGGVLAHFGIHG